MHSFKTFVESIIRGTVDPVVAARRKMQRQDNDIQRASTTGPERYAAAANAKMASIRNDQAKKTQRVQKVIQQRQNKVHKLNIK